MKNFLTFNALGIFSLIILAFLFFQAKNYYNNEGTKHKKLWIASIVSTFIAQLLDIVCWALSGIPGGEIRIVAYFANSLCFISFGVFCSVLALFIDYNTNYSEKSYNFLIKIFSPVIIINTILSVLSIWLQFYYKLGSTNNYIRGDLNFISIILDVFPLMFVILRMFIKYNHENMQLKSILLVSLIFPLVFTVMQVTNVFPIPVQIPSITLAILFLYLFLINSSIYLDYLTGLQNKKGVNKYFDELPSVLNNYLAVIFIDINDFKHINDVYGHKEGDDAIVDFSKVLSKAARKNDLVSRFGGDEFLIASIVNSEDGTKLIIERIEIELGISNKQSNKEYELSISYGVSITYPNTQINKEKMISEADEKMYIHKNKRINS